MRQRATRQVGPHPMQNLASTCPTPLPMPAGLSLSSTVGGDSLFPRSLGSLLLYPLSFPALVPMSGDMLSVLVTFVITALFVR